MKKADNVYIAPNATVIGDVKLEESSSVWFGAVLRGDSDSIHIGKGSNIQDLAVVHVDPGVPVHVGEGVTVGHAAIIHGATIGDFTLVGMRATVMNNAKVGKYCIIGAHALVTEGMEIPDYSVVMGTPGKVVKQLPEKTTERLHRSAEHYQERGREYLAGKYKNEV
ncbi:gamma carbonic anhydrase family protein [Roseivirga sp. BDSF3-8]|uniref:gamma carbonic anhydrase family protein n=1 Tax=Roseivirga sp. BDSF3-8 TaxID=3241598 RepID=UPI003531C234